MSDQFLAEIRIFPFNFPPTGWAFCDGQLMPLSQNTALFALLGTTYGGDGKSTFALPDLRGRAAMQPGMGAGLSERIEGEEGGSEAISLLVSEIPLHTHVVGGTFNPGDVPNPSPQTSLGQSVGGGMYVSGNPSPPLEAMAFEGFPPAGGGLPHNNMQPYLTLNFCIALQGIFPQRP